MPRLIAAAALPLFALAAWAGPALDLSDPIQAVEAWVRLKGDSDGSITYEWMTGTAYGIPQGSMSTALFDIESVTIRQFQRRGPGHYAEQTFACRLYRHSSTREFIQRWTNPYTQEDIDLKPGCRPGITVIYSPAGAKLDSEMAFNSTALGKPMQLQVVNAGNHLIVRREAHSEYQASPDAEPRRETSIDTFKVKPGYLTDPDRSHWLPQYQWTSATLWMTLLNMGNRPGGMLWSINGRNYLGAEELPNDFRRAVQRLAPGSLEHRFDWN